MLRHLSYECGSGQAAFIKGVFALTWRMPDETFGRFVRTWGSTFLGCSMAMLASLKLCLFG
jgi:hypothetical protein